jgi:hypothetical protein
MGIIRASDQKGCLTYDIANGAGALVQIVQKRATGPEDNAPKVLLLAPPPVARLTDLAEMFEGEKRNRPYPERFSQSQP